LLCLRLGRKLQEYNVTLPTVTIEYEGLTAKTDATKGSANITTVGNLPMKVNTHTLQKAKPYTLVSAATAAWSAGQAKRPLISADRYCGPRHLQQAVKQTAGHLQHTILQT
jgi:hypothetical protein